MAEPESLGVEEALDNLVSQFSDPMSFLRELIQNSLDAGTPSIEVWMEFDGGEGADDKGVMIIHVDDFGEGMDKAIIDTKLTRLFSSAKDGDFTKIGRFGIGFVSVFAIAPDAVCVDTSRGGENWRVLFQADRSFAKIARDEPVDGTKIQVIKSVTRAEFEGLRDRARATLSYWCKHVEDEIYFDDVLINEAFDLPLSVKVRHIEPGTEIVVGYTESAADTPLIGYYNKGLTLLEQQEAMFEGVSFKISSRYLEHTLTRDNVLRDDHYDKAMTIVRRLVERELPVRLFEVIAERVEAGQAEDPDARRLWELAGPLLADGKGPSRAERAVVGHTLDGEPATLGAVLEAKRKGRLYRDLERSHVTDALAADKALVLALSEEGGLARALGGLPRAGERWCAPLAPSDDHEAARYAPLCAATRELFEDRGARLSDVHVMHLAYPGSAIEQRVAISQKKPGALDEVEATRDLGSGLFSRRRALIVNADHPTVAELVPMAHAEPELAAYLLAKLFYLGGGLSTDLDGELAQLAMARRARRLSASRG